MVVLTMLQSPLLLLHAPTLWELLWLCYNTMYNPSPLFLTLTHTQAHQLLAALSDYLPVPQS